MGTTVNMTCTYDVSKLFSPNLYERPNNENIFYELFIQDYNGDLIDVPVLITGLTKGATQPNVNTDTSLWQFVRRFFVYDTISGLSKRTPA